MKKRILAIVMTLTMAVAFMPVMSFATENTRGEGVSTYDLMDTITSDMLKINLAAVLAVFLVLVVMFRKLLLPLLLVASIETAIWINVAVPCLPGLLYIFDRFCVPREGTLKKSMN